MVMNPRSEQGNYSREVTHRERGKQLELEVSALSAPKEGWKLEDDVYLISNSLSAMANPRKGIHLDFRR